MVERPRNAYGDVLFGIEVRADETLIGLMRLRDAERQVFRRDGQWYDMFTMGPLEGELR